MSDLHMSEALLDLLRIISIHQDAVSNLKNGTKGIIGAEYSLVYNSDLDALKETAFALAEAKRKAVQSMKKDIE